MITKNAAIVLAIVGIGVSTAHANSFSATNAGPLSMYADFDEGYPENGGYTVLGHYDLTGPGVTITRNDGTPTDHTYTWNGWY